MQESFDPKNYRNNLAKEAKDTRKGSFFTRVTNPLVSKEEKQRRIDEATKQVREILEVAQATEEYKKAVPERGERKETRVEESGSRKTSG